MALCASCCATEAEELGVTVAACPASEIGVGDDGNAEHLGFGKSGAARIGRCNAVPDPDLETLTDLARLTIVGLVSAGEGAKLQLASANDAASAAGL